MPRYFFNVTHDEVIPDLAGVELPSQSAAWEEAANAAGEMIKDLHGSLKPGREWKMQVTDEFQNQLWEIHLKGERKA